MAGNNKIQFFRGVSTKRQQSTDILNPGQPFYEVDTHTLYVGNNNILSEVTPVNAYPLPHSHDDLQQAVDTVNTAVDEVNLKVNSLVTYGTEDLVDGESTLPTGTLYLVYESAGDDVE